MSKRCLYELYYFAKSFNWLEFIDFEKGLICDFESVFYTQLKVMLEMTAVPQCFLRYSKDIHVSYKHNISLILLSWGVDICSTTFWTVLHGRYKNKILPWTQQVMSSWWHPRCRQSVYHRNTLIVWVCVGAPGGLPAPAGMRDWLLFIHYLLHLKNSVN